MVGGHLNSISEREDTAGTTSACVSTSNIGCRGQGPYQQLIFTNASTQEILSPHTNAWDYTT
jgi:hypothetical protein